MVLFTSKGGHLMSTTPKQFRMLPPFKALTFPCHDELRVRGLLATFLTKTMCVPHDHLSALMEAIIRQAKSVPEKQCGSLSQASAYVIGKYCGLWKDYPGRGLHALWVLEDSGFTFSRQEEGIRTIQELHSWINNLLFRSGFHQVAISAQEWISEEMRLSLAALHVPAENLEGELYFSRSVWMYEFLLRLIKWFGDEKVQLETYCHTVTLTSLMVEDAMELTALLMGTVIEEDEEQVQIQFEPVTPTPLYQHFRFYAPLCWQMILIAKKEGISKKDLMQWSFEMGKEWIAWLTSAFQIELLDRELFETVLTNISFLKNRSQEEVFNLLFAWREVRREGIYSFPAFVNRFDDQEDPQIPRLVHALISSVGAFYSK
ncbi:TPA: hypothetical protein DEP26_01735 [Candidatus Uhrbacteria bacterium]|nr:hypothetical protein [Candidatus Uhrbacteria bacterium]